MARADAGWVVVVVWLMLLRGVMTTKWWPGGQGASPPVKGYELRVSSRELSSLLNFDEKFVEI